MGERSAFCNILQHTDIGRSVAVRSCLMHFTLKDLRWKGSGSTIYPNLVNNVGASGSRELNSRVNMNVRCSIKSGVQDHRSVE